MSPIKRTIPPRAAPLRARANWERAAEVWLELVGAGTDWSRELVHGPALLRAVEPVRGQRVLDVGCGQGYFTRVLARRGAHVLGVDWSAGMIRLARESEKDRPLGAEYRRMDARRIGSAFPARSFDLVVACMSFMDLPGPDRVLEGARRLLRPSGRVAFSIAHPIHTPKAAHWSREGPRGRGGWLVDGYFERVPYEFSWKVPGRTEPFRAIHWHRTFEDWLRMLGTAGFRLERVVEPHPSARAVAHHPELAVAARVPIWLVVVGVPAPRARRVRARRVPG